MKNTIPHRLPLHATPKWLPLVFSAVAVLSTMAASTAVYARGSTAQASEVAETDDEMDDRLEREAALKEKEDEDRSSSLKNKDGGRSSSARKPAKVPPRQDAPVDEEDHAQVRSIQQPAPAFSLLDQNGSRISLSDFKGQVVFLDFWASWCPPCKQSFPFMNEIQQNYGHRGLRVIAVNTDSNKLAAEEFLRSTPAYFTIGFDSGMQTARKYKVKAMPYSVLIDKSGMIIEYHQGFTPAESRGLKTLIEAALR